MSDCIPWHRYCQPKGYGIACRYGRIMLAHRHVWEECFGPLADGYVLHHRCHNPSCINPEHLEPMEKVAHDRSHPPTREIARLGGKARGVQLAAQARARRAA